MENQLARLCQTHSVIGNLLYAGSLSFAPIEQQSVDIDKLQL